MEEVSITREPKVQFWCDIIEAYDKDTKSWVKRSTEIEKRYLDDRGESDKQASKFNIFWSNVNTLHPALYNGVPKPNIDRRFDDEAEINTTVAIILERCVTKFVNTNRFDECLSQCVLGS